MWKARSINTNRPRKAALEIQTHRRASSTDDVEFVSVTTPPGDDILEVWTVTPATAHGTGGRKGRKVQRTRGGSETGMTNDTARQTTAEIIEIHSSSSEDEGPALHTNTGRNRSRPMELTPNLDVAMASRRYDITPQILADEFNQETEAVKSDKGQQELHDVQEGKGEDECRAGDKSTPQNVLKQVPPRYSYRSDGYHFDNAIGCGMDYGKAGKPNSNSKCNIIVSGKSRADAPRPQVGVDGTNMTKTTGSEEVKGIGINRADTQQQVYAATVTDASANVLQPGEDLMKAVQMKQAIDVSKPPDETGAMKISKAPNSGRGDGINIHGPNNPRPQVGAVEIRLTNTTDSKEGGDIVMNKSDVQKPGDAETGAITRAELFLHVGDHLDAIQV